MNSYLLPACCNSRHLSAAGLILIAVLGAQARASAAESVASSGTVVERFVDGYNARDIERALEPLAEEVRAYKYPGQLVLEGKEQMRAYLVDAFSKAPNLRCEILQRIELGATVIDKERIVGLAQVPLEEIAIYEVKDGKIIRIEAVSK